MPPYPSTENSPNVRSLSTLWGLCSRSHRAGPPLCTLAAARAAQSLLSVFSRPEHVPSGRLVPPESKEAGAVEAAVQDMAGHWRC